MYLKVYKWSKMAKYRVKERATVIRIREEQGEAWIQTCNDKQIAA